jgi:hypothetical protein
MNLTAQKFINRITAAYKAGDLSNPFTLGDALACLNYIDSTVENNFVKDCLFSLADNVISDLPIKPARHNKGLCTKPVSKRYEPLFWVEDKKTIFKDRHISLRNKEWTIQYINKQLMSPNAFRRQILWLSDLDGVMPAPGSDVWCLLYDLGYFGRVFEDELWICRVSVDNLHKPTWVDAGFTFFWYAAPAAEDHGQTRSLLDGRLRFKEWVAKKEVVSVEDVGFLLMTTTGKTPILDIADLLPDYVSNCADEVIARRGDSGKVGN